MEQDREKLLSTVDYAKSKYKESSSLSNKSSCHTLNLCKVERNEETVIVMNLTYEQARDYEINLLWKQLQTINKKIKAIEYYLNLADFRGHLIELKGKGDIDYLSEEGDRLYSAFSKFDFVYKYGLKVGIMGQVEVSDTTNLYNKLENYRLALLKEFNNPIIDLDGANWVGVAMATNVADKTMLVLRNGTTIEIDLPIGLYNTILRINEGVVDLKDLKGNLVCVRGSELAMLYKI